MEILLTSEKKGEKRKQLPEVTRHKSSTVNFRMFTLIFCVLTVAWTKKTMILLLVNLGTVLEGKNT